jgi:hypothetical protein
MSNFKLWHIILLAFFLIKNRIFYNIITNKFNLTEKQKAHILSLKNAIVLSIFSVFFNYKYFIHGEVYPQISECIMIYFTGYLLSDLFIGSNEYPSKLNFFEAYVHHFVYIFVNTYSIFNFHTFFNSLFFIAEVPTILLSYYNAFDKPKNKKLYSNLFLIFRVIILIIITLFTLSDKTIKFFSIPAILLHIYWYRKSIKSSKKQSND